MTTRASPAESCVILMNYWPLNARWVIFLFRVMREHAFEMASGRAGEDAPELSSTSVNSNRNVKCGEKLFSNWKIVLHSITELRSGFPAVSWLMRWILFQSIARSPRVPKQSPIFSEFAALGKQARPFEIKNKCTNLYSLKINETKSTERRKAQSSKHFHRGWQ